MIPEVYFEQAFNKRGIVEAASFGQLAVKRHDLSVAWVESIMDRRFTGQARED
jgi:hypothetical protein